MGGTKCRVLVTTRDALIARSIDAELYDLDVMTPDQAMALLAKKVKRDLNGVERSLALTLAETVDYLPLALELAGAQVADGVSWAELVSDLRAEIAILETLDLPGQEDVIDENSRKRLSLLASFHLSVRRLSSVRLTAFAWLGVLPEDVLVTSAMAATLWDTDARTARDMLRYLYDKSLLLVGSSTYGNSLSYRIHDLLHDLARRLLTGPTHPNTPSESPGLALALPKAHGLLLERYCRHSSGMSWHTLPDDGYIHSHLAWHMEQAVWIDGIHALLREETNKGENAWYTARVRLGQVAGFMEDLARAERLASEGTGDVRSPLAISYQCRYALITSSLGTLARSIPASLITALVVKGVWTHAQAFGHVLQISDPVQRADALASLAPHLPTALLEEAVCNLALLDRKGHSMGLVQIVEQLTQRGRFEEALNAERMIKNASDRARAFSSLLSELPPDLRQQAVRESLLAASDIENATLRQRVIGALVSSLASLGHLRAAHNVLRTALEGQVKSDTLDMMVETDNELAVKEILSMLGTTQDQALRSEVITGLGHALRGQLLENAVQIIQGIGDEGSRLHILTKLLASRAATGAEYNLMADLITQSEDSLSAYSREWSIAAIRNPEVLRARLQLLSLLPIKKKEEVFRRMINAARSSEHDEARARLVQELGAYLTEGDSADAFWLARTIQTDLFRARALLDVSSHLVPKHRQNAALREALLAARGLADSSGRTNLLLELALRAEELGLAQLSQDVLTAAQGIRDPLQRANTLLALMQHVSTDERERVLVEGLTSARSIPNVKDRVRSLVQFSFWATEIQKAEILEEVFQTREIILQSDVLREVISVGGDFLPEIFVQRALELALRIPEDADRQHLLALLAPHMSASQLRQVVAEVHVIRDRDAFISTFVVVFPYLRDAFLEKALNVLDSVSDERTRARLLSQLVVHLPESLWSKALSAVSDLKRSENKARALEHLLPRLDSAYFEDGINLVKGIVDSNERIAVLAKWVPHLDEPHKSQIMTLTLEMLSSIQDVAHKSASPSWMIRQLSVEPLSCLIPSMSSDERVQAISQVLRSLPQTQDPSIRVLKRLAPLMSQEEKLRVLWYVLPSQGSATKARIIKEMEPFLPDSLLSAAVEAAKSISAVRFRVEALTELYQRLSVETRNKLTPKMLKYAREVENDRNRVHALTELSGCLAEPLRSQVIAEALEGARALRTSVEKASALICLGCRLVSPVREEMHGEALAVAEEIRSRREWTSFLFLSQAQLVLLPGESLYKIWQDTLSRLSSGTRSDLLVGLQVLIPAIAAVEGAEAACGIFEAIQDAGRWWP